jgi:hypothetical protein
MFLQPVGDNAAVAAALRNLEPDEDNLDQIVDVSLHAGVDPELGFGLVLENYGTCNAITTFDQVMPGRPLAAQQAAAAMLLRKLHSDLVASVTADVAQQEGRQPRENTLAELLGHRDWLLAENAYHIDTTHLAAVVRFARLLDNPDHLRMAIDLTEYGRRLGPQFQYKHDEPFSDFYPAHALYFRAMLSENVEEAVRYFREKAETLEPRQHGTMAIETYIDLLARLGLSQEAMEASLSLLPHDMPTLGFAPPLFDLCRRAGRFDRLMQHCRERDDLLGYGVALMQAKLQSQP